MVGPVKINPWSIGLMDMTGPDLLFSISVGYPGRAEEARKTRETTVKLLQTVFPFLTEEEILEAALDVWLRGVPNMD
jgi:hypothetical protein